MYKVDLQGGCWQQCFYALQMLSVTCFPSEVAAAKVLCGLRASLQMYGGDWRWRCANWRSLWLICWMWVI
jgi:hypothetical protein